HTNLRGLSSTASWALICVCLLSVARLQAQPAAPKIDYVNAGNTACKIGRPNVSSGESVAWQGQCVGGYASGHGVAQWSAAGKPVSPEPSPPVAATPSATAEPAKTESTKSPPLTPTTPQLSPPRVAPAAVTADAARNGTDQEKSQARKVDSEPGIFDRLKKL